VNIPLRLYPGMSPFVLDWMEEDARATRFLQRVPQSPLPLAGEGGAKRRVRAELLQALIDSNRRWGLFVEEDLRRWAAGGTITLTAGQQVGFAGGPLYTLAKIASLIKMKRELEKSGRQATIFFWLATEDHDFDEVAKLFVPVNTIERDHVNRQLDLLCLRATRPVESKSVLGRVPIPEALIAELLALYDMPRPQWLREGITFGGSFAALIASVFGPEVILVDSLLPELRRAGAPLFDAIRSQWDALQSALAARSAELESSGYPPQIHARPGEPYTLLFEIDEHGERQALHEPRSLDPERTSTSALTRPLLQDFVFRPDVFVGGPAEVSYYAQIAPLHEILGVGMPRVALRGHVLVAPKRVLRFLERFDVKPAEIFGSPEALLAERESKDVAEVKRIAAAAKKDLLSNIERIGEIALPAEHSLARAISRSVGHIEYHFNKLTERAIKALVRKNKERHAAAKEMVVTLYPDGHVQDRVVGWFPFWCRYDRYLIDRLIGEIEPDTASFRIVGL
jgi:uncharacterized protein YllA (UPF0747 family)